MKNILLAFSLYLLFCAFTYALFSFQQLDLNPFLWDGVARIFYSFAVGFVAAMIVMLSCIDLSHGMKAPNPEDSKK